MLCNHRPFSPLLWQPPQRDVYTYTDGWFPILGPCRHSFRDPLGSLGIFFLGSFQMLGVRNRSEAFHWRGHIDLWPVTSQTSSQPTLSSAIFFQASSFSPLTLPPVLPPPSTFIFTLISVLIDFFRFLFFFLFILFFNSFRLPFSSCVTLMNSLG